MERDGVAPLVHFILKKKKKKTGWGILPLMASMCFRGTYITDDTHETDIHTAEQSDTCS